jgi:hypothetical protein
MAYKHRHFVRRHPRTWLWASTVLIIAELNRRFLERVNNENTTKNCCAESICP